MRMGAADLDDPGELFGLPVERRVKVCKRRDQVALVISIAAAMCIAVGKQSFDDWLMLT